MKKNLFNRELDNLLFFYELYLNEIDEENYLEWSLLFDIRTKIEERLRRIRNNDSMYIRKKLSILDKELKNKAKFYNARILCSRLRKMTFPKPPKNYWWYYLDETSDKSRKVKYEASLREKELSYSYG